MYEPASLDLPDLEFSRKKEVFKNPIPFDCKESSTKQGLGSKFLPSLKCLESLRISALCSCAKIFTYLIQK